jgi:hypothetical protein
MGADWVCSQCFRGPLIRPYDKGGKDGDGWRSESRAYQRKIRMKVPHGPRLWRRGHASRASRDDRRGDVARASRRGRVVCGRPWSWTLETLCARGRGTRAEGEAGEPSSWSYARIACKMRSYFCRALHSPRTRTDTLSRRRRSANSAHTWLGPLVLFGTPCYSWWGKTRDGVAEWGHPVTLLAAVAAAAPAAANSR